MSWSCLRNRLFERLGTGSSAVHEFRRRPVVRVRVPDNMNLGEVDPREITPASAVPVPPQRPGRGSRVRWM